jgi:hypothetical protein
MGGELAVPLVRARSANTARGSLEGGRGNPHSGYLSPWPRHKAPREAGPARHQPRRSIRCGRRAASEILSVGQKQVNVAREHPDLGQLGSKPLCSNILYNRELQKISPHPSSVYAFLLVRSQ